MKMSENTVEIPKAMADRIRKLEWFTTMYIDLEDFVLSAVRRQMEKVERRR